MDKYIRYLFITICLIGCILQIHEISLIYFKYETTTDVRYENEVNISLPAVSICFYKSYLIRNEYLLQIFPNGTKNLKDNEKFKR